KKSNFHDDFATDSRQDYRVRGEVTWAKGRLTLTPNAALVRPLDTYTTDVQAVVRPPAGVPSSGVVLRMVGKPGVAAVGFALLEGRPTLVNLTQQPIHQVDLPAGGKADAGPWVVRLHFCFGLIRGKAWRQDRPEP